MKKLVVKFFLSAFILQVLFVPSSVATEKHLVLSTVSQELLPLKKGNYWIYEGVARWTVPRSGKVREKNVRWKMEVVDVIGRDFITAAVIKGHPQDLAWYEEGARRGDYLILSIGNSVYYFLEGLRAEEVLARLKDKEDILGNLVFNDELFLKTPFPAANSGLDEGLSSTGGAWAEASREIKSLDCLPGQNAYRLTFRSLPDRTFVDFIPGIGITRYNYHHNGLVSETDLKLVEYLAG